MVFLVSFFTTFFAFEFCRFIVVRSDYTSDSVLTYICITLGEGKLDLNLMVSVSLLVLVFISQIFKVLVARCDYVLQDMCIML